MKAVEYYIDFLEEYLAVEQRAILLDLVVKFIKEGSVKSFRYTVKIFNFLKNLLRSELETEVISKLLKIWSSVCKFFDSQSLKDILDDMKIFVDKEDGGILNSVENYLKEDCNHNIGCMKLVKIFYTTKELFCVRALPKIEANKENYTQVLLMKLSTYILRISSESLLSCGPCLSILSMALEACRKKCKYGKQDLWSHKHKEGSIKLYSPDQKETKYFDLFFSLLSSSGNEDSLNNQKFIELLKSLKPVLLCSSSLLVRFLAALKKSKVPEEDIKRLLGQCVIDCYFNHFRGAMDNIQANKYDVLISEMREARQVVETYVVNGRSQFHERVVEYLCKNFFTKLKMCSMIREAFPEQIE